MGGKYSQFRITQAVILVFIFRFSHRYVRMYARRIHFLHIYKQTCVHRITPTFGNVHSTYVCTYICTYLNMKKTTQKCNNIYTEALTILTNGINTFVYLYKLIRKMADLDAHAKYNFDCTASFFVCMHTCMHICTHRRAPNAFTHKHTRLTN